MNSFTTLLYCCILLFPILSTRVYGRNGASVVLVSGSSSSAALSVPMSSLSPSLSSSSSFPSLSTVCAELTAAQETEQTAFMSACPMQFLQRALYYQPAYLWHRHAHDISVTHYYEELDPNKMFCDISCSLSDQRQVSSNDTEVSTSSASSSSSSSSSSRGRGNVTRPSVVRGTVARTVRELKELLYHLRRHSGGVGWCTLGEDREGAWVPRTLWESLVEQRQMSASAQASSMYLPRRVLISPPVKTEVMIPSKTSGDHSHSVARGLLEGVVGEVMGGDVSMALQWPNVWVPSTCRSYRYNLTSISRCASEHYRRTNASLWIYFLGDSTTRGIFCGFLRLLTKGGECRGVVPTFPCYGGTPLGTKFYVNKVPQELTYSCPKIHLKVSFQLTYESGSLYMPMIFKALLSNDHRHDTPFRAKISMQRSSPTHVIYNSGAWNALRFNYKTETERLRSRGTRKPKPNTFLSVLVDYSHRTPVTQLRKEVPVHMRQLLNQLASYGFQGTFIFRNNVCNVRYDPRYIDEGVEQVVKEYGRKLGLRTEVLDVYNFSVCRGVEMMRDDTHFDRMFASEAPKEKPSLGELNMQVVQSLLNGVCNPYLA